MVEAAELQFACFGNLRVVLADGAGVGGVVVHFHQPPEQVGSASFAGKFFPAGELLATDKRTQEVQPPHQGAQVMREVAVVLAP